MKPRTPPQSSLQRPSLSPNNSSSANNRYINTTHNSTMAGGRDQYYHHQNTVGGRRTPVTPTRPLEQPATSSFQAARPAPNPMTSPYRDPQSSVTPTMSSSSFEMQDKDSAYNRSSQPQPQPQPRQPMKHQPIQQYYQAHDDPPYSPAEEPGGPPPPSSNTQYSSSNGATNGASVGGGGYQPMRTMEAGVHSQRYMEPMDQQESNVLPGGLAGTPPKEEEEEEGVHLHFDADTVPPSQSQGTAAVAVGGDDPLERGYALIKAGDAEGLRALCKQYPAEKLSEGIPRHSDLSLMHLAVDARHYHCTLALVEAGVAVGRPAAGTPKITPLVLAMRKFPDVVMPMIKTGKGKNLKLPDSDGRNSLHHAVWGKRHMYNWDRLACVKVLVQEHSVSCGHRCKQGFTPAEWARENYHQLGIDQEAIATYLEEPPKEDLRRKKITREGANESYYTPWFRLFCLLVLGALHAVQYSADRTLRRRTSTQQNEDFLFNFIFDTFNMVGSHWPKHNTPQLIVKLVSILAGFLFFGGVSYQIVYRFFLKRVLALRIFGAGHRSLDGGRGSLVVMFCFAFSGIYFAGLIYNLILDREFSKHEEKYKMTNNIGVTHIQALGTFTCLTLCLDTYCFFLVFDTMLQQVSNRVFLPFSAYSSWMTCLHRSWHKLRYVWYWLVFHGVVFGIAFSLFWHWDNFANGESPPIDINASGRIAVTSCSLLVTFVIMSQEWTMPYLYRIEDIKVPGWCFSINNAWLLWFICLCTMAMDTRLLIDQIQSYIDDDDEDTASWQFGCALIPTGIAALGFFGMMMRNSLWWRCCGSVDDDVVKQLMEESDDDENHIFGRGGVTGRPVTQPPRSVQKGVFMATPFHSPAVKKAPTKGGTPFSKNATTRPTGREDVWSCAYNDDVMRMCTLLDADPALLNMRGGAGLFIHQQERTVAICSPPDARYAATPLHYAIAGNAKSTIAALISRGANTRIRTSHGMWTCKELAGVSNCTQFVDILATH